MPVTRGRRYVEVENYSTEPHRIYDRELPGGYIDLQSGETYALPANAFLRNLRAAKRWMRRVTPGPVEAKPALESLKMQELRALARERQITAPVGTSKAELIALLGGN